MSDNSPAERMQGAIVCLPVVDCYNGNNKGGLKKVHLFANKKRLLWLTVKELPIPNMVFRHLNEKAEREEYIRGSNERDKKNEKLTYSNMQPAETIQQEKQVTTKETGVQNSDHARKGNTE